MVIMNNYAELVRLIDIVKTEIEMLEQDNKFSLSTGESLPFSSKGRHRDGVDDFSRRIDRLNLRITQLREKLDYYRFIEEEIRVNIEKLAGLPYTIAKLRFIEGHSYKEIADTLGFSYSYIRKVVSKNNEGTKHIDNL